MQTSIHARLEDPLHQGAVRTARAHALDGLSDLGQAAALMLASSIAGLKLWWPTEAPSLTLPLIVLVFGIIFLIRKAVDRIRLNISTTRTGYVGSGTFHPKGLLLYISPVLALAVAAKFGLIGYRGFLILIGCCYGGLQIAKVHYTGVRHRIVTGSLTILLGFALAFSGWGFLFCMFVGTTVEATISLVVGACLLKGYLRLPLRAEVENALPLD